MIKLNYYPSYTQAAARALTQQLQNISTPVLLLFSGGSALQILDNLDPKIFNHSFTIGVLDERYTPNSNHTNFHQFKHTRLGQQIATQPIHFFTNHLGENNLKLAAQNFDRQLHAWKTKYPNGQIVITQGIGQDGHTAGIFPYPENPQLFNELFEKRDQWAVGYSATGKPEIPKRITVTLTFLREQVDQSLVYVVGKEKQSALQKTLASTGSLAQTPSRIIHEMKNVQIFTDVILDLSDKINLLC